MVWGTYVDGICLILRSAVLNFKWKHIFLVTYFYRFLRNYIRTNINTLQFMFLDTSYIQKHNVLKKIVWSTDIGLSNFFSFANHTSLSFDEQLFSLLFLGSSTTCRLATIAYIQYNFLTFIENLQQIIFYNLFSYMYQTLELSTVLYILFKKVDVMVFLIFVSRSSVRKRKK